MKNLVVKPLSMVYPVGVFLLGMVSWITANQANGVGLSVATNSHLDPGNRTPNAITAADKNSCDSKDTPTFGKSAVCKIDGTSE